MSDNPFEMTADVNGKPIPRWQERLEQMYTDKAPFGEILSYVRYLVEERDVAAILSAPDDVILAATDGDPEQYATEMRQKFDVIARLTRENEQLRERLATLHEVLTDPENQLEQTKGGYYIYRFDLETMHRIADAIGLVRVAPSPTLAFYRPDELSTLIRPA